jgi:thioredoxin 1
VPKGELFILDEDSFDGRITQAQLPVLVDFWTDWCAPCKRLAQTLRELAAELAGRVEIAMVDVDANGDLAYRYGIQSVPTLIVFKRGHVVDQMIGAAPKSHILRMLDRHHG